MWVCTTCNPQLPRRCSLSSLRTSVCGIKQSAYACNCRQLHLQQQQHQQQLKESYGKTLEIKQSQCLFKSPLLAEFRRQIEKERSPNFIMCTGISQATWGSGEQLDRNRSWNWASLQIACQLDLLLISISISILILI